MAIGASRGDIVRSILGYSAKLTAAGSDPRPRRRNGATRLLSTFLFGIAALDPKTFVAVAVLLGAVALLASYLPTRRAAKVDPIVALRQD